MTFGWIVGMVTACQVVPLKRNPWPLIVSKAQMSLAAKARTIPIEY